MSGHNVGAGVKVLPGPEVKAVDWMVWTWYIPYISHSSGGHACVPQYPLSNGRELGAPPTWCEPLGGEGLY